MNELNLRLITTGDLESLEKVLHSSCADGLHIKNFSAEHKPERGYYEVKMCIAGVANRNQVVMNLAEQKSIRELTPIRR